MIGGIGMPFCSNCGSQVQAGDRFCNNCGATLRPVSPPPQQAQAPPPPPPPQRGGVSPPVAQQAGYQPEAELIGITVTGLKKPKSFGRWDTFSLLISPQRMILAPLTSEAINKAVMDTRDKAKADGKGFWGQWGAQIGTSFRYADRFKGWTPDAAVADNPGSVVIPNDSVTEVKLLRDRKGRGSGGVEQIYYRLEIRSTVGEYRFELDGLDEQFQGFHQLFGGRFRTDAGFGGFKISIG